MKEIADTEEELGDIDLQDEDDFKEQAMDAMKGIGLLEDEAEMQFEDMFGYQYYQIRSKEDMNGKKLKKKYPKFAKKHNINDEDFLYFVGDKIRVLRKGSFTRNN